MTVDVAILLILFFGFVALLRLPSVMARRRAPQEAGLTPLFEESCVVRRDFGSGTSRGRNMFLWRLSLYPDFMVLSLRTQAIVPYREIDRVELNSYQDRKEVWIYRQVDAVSELITVASKNPEQLVKVLTSVGVRFVTAPPRTGKHF